MNELNGRDGLVKYDSDTIKNIVEQQRVSKTVEGIQKLDINIDAGAAYSLIKKINLELRYNYGLSKVIKENNSGKNRVFQISISYIFWRYKYS